MQVVERLVDVNNFCDICCVWQYIAGITYM